MTQPDTITIEMDQKTREFYQGVASGSQVRKAHAEVTEGQPVDVKSRLYWFFVGALAAGEHKLTGDFDQFILGATTRAPENDTIEDEAATFDQDRASDV